MAQKPSRHHNQVIKVHRTSNEIQQHYEPPDMTHWGWHSLTLTLILAKNEQTSDKFKPRDGLHNRHTTEEGRIKATWDPGIKRKQGYLGGSVVMHLPLAQVVILGSWD